MVITSRPYHVEGDPVISALRAEAEADPSVIGIVVTGSRAVGVVTDESDYDVIFVVTDATMERYIQGQAAPVRGQTVHPPISTGDIWDDSLQALRDMASNPDMAGAVVVYDRTGETTAVIDALRRIPADLARDLIASSYDGYLNNLYRSLKSWRRGNELGGRLEAAGTVDPLLHTLFALEGHWRPFSSRLYLHLDKLSGQGWQPDELPGILLDLISTGNPRRQQELARRVAQLLRERGYEHVYQSWDGQIDTALAWSFE